jgi:hypothetical protein
VPNDLPPDRGLADAGLALEHEHGEVLARRVEEFLGERELALTPDHVYHVPESLRFLHQRKAR